MILALVLWSAWPSTCSLCVCRTISGASAFKRSLSAHYKAFRKGCIQTMLGVVHGKIDTRTAEALIEPDKFRQYFQEPVGARKSRWHEFFNNLNETSLRELQTSMEIFREELIFILNNTDIQKDEAFEFIKRFVRFHLLVEFGYGPPRRGGAAI